MRSRPNDDAVPSASVTVAPSAVAEDGAANLVYTVSLDHASAFDTTVSFTLTGTASEGADYTAVTHSVTIPAGQTSVDVTIDPTADTTYENGESVVLTLTGGSTNGQAVTLGTTVATGSITHDDAVPTASVTVAPSAVAEDSAANLVYTVALDHAAAFDATISFTFIDSLSDCSKSTGMVVGVGVPVDGD